MRITLLVLLGSLSWAAPSSGQTSISGPAASVLFHDLQRPLPGSMPWEASRDTVHADIRPTYWKEGALIGAVAGAVGGAFLGYGLCGMSDEIGKSCSGSLLLGGIIGAGLLAIPGALIGGQFPKHEGAEEKETVE